MSSNTNKICVAFCGPHRQKFVATHCAGSPLRSLFRTRRLSSSALALACFSVGLHLSRSGFPAAGSHGSHIGPSAAGGSDADFSASQNWSFGWPPIETTAPSVELYLHAATSCGVRCAWSIGRAAANFAQGKTLRIGKWRVGFVRPLREGKERLEARLRRPLTWSQSRYCLKCAASPSHFGRYFNRGSSLLLAC